MIWILIPLAIINGVLGRMGGADNYDKLWRRLGCSIVMIVAFLLVLGFNAKEWWIYLTSFILTWGALSTYWDRLFGYDNLFFSGLMVGLAAMPLVIAHPYALGLILGRSFALGIIWYALNKFVPKKGILGLRRDIAEEFFRYFFAV